MAIKGYMESSLSKSVVFAGINGHEQRVTEKAVVNLIKTAKHLTNEDIEAAYIAVKQINDTLTREAVKAFDNEQTVLVYNDNPSLSVTQTLPFITFKNGKTYVFMDKYIHKSRDGVLNLQSPVLRDLLISALISSALKKNYESFASNQYLQKTLMKLYTDFFMRIINREYSLAADKIIMDTVQYWVNRFFLEKIFCATDDPDNIEKLASSHIKYIDEIQYNDIKKQYETSNPSTITNIIEDMLQEFHPRMKGISLGKFLSAWANYYYIPSMLAVDNVEYLIFMIICLLAGNGSIFNISASDIVKECKGIKSLREELIKLI